MALDSKLSDTAKEVKPELDETYMLLNKSLDEIKKELHGEFGTTEDIEGVHEEIKEAIGKETLITLANKIIRGEASQKEKIDFEIYFADIQSKLTADPNLSERQARIRKNFARKLKNSILEIT